ncbi:aminotransferase class IV [Brachybacterium halotolerans subsp. kimchii]|uniref:aminotransferase class IV n=1 Tax=Brachybacterium halotolerans TaxID=2795215 RepID=UPI001E3F5CD5|nr:aminotransferase class IV [Brachybacterium halotolerans]UEJ81742.1 aminotransferase class IV [Brachybacterium halotolerans subsp. kimchii]
MSSRPAVLVMIPGVAADPALKARPAFRLVDEGAPQLRVTDLAATRGDGVFETVGVFDSRPANLTPHLERLQRSARMLDLPALDLDVLAQAVDAAVTAHLPVPELLVKIVVSRGVEGQPRPTAWVYADAAPSYASARAGLRVAALDRGIPTTAPQTSPWLLAGAKSLSYAINMAALREASRRGADEVLFVSSDGYALEGPTSTLLVKRGDRFLTTPVDAGVLPGTSLGSVFELVRGEGAEAAEELLTPAQVAAADGAWLLSSVRLACPITHLDDAELPVDRALTDRLSAAIAGRK